MSLRIHNLRSNILVHPLRKLNFKFMVVEWIWVARGWDNLWELARVNPNIAEFSDNGKTLAGAYGPRLLPQWEYVLTELRNKDSRRAVATIWTPSPVPSKDIPCTISLQWLLRGEKLNCIVTMRSSDVWLGLPYDMFVFSQLTSSLAGELSCETGWIQFNLGSSHLYEKHEAQAIEVLAATHLGLTLMSPRLPGMLPGVVTTEPWLSYSRAIEAKTSGHALEVLNGITPKP